MNIGTLNQRVIIDLAVDVQDATTGAVETTWTPIKAVWAEIEPLKGRERLTNGGTLAEMDTRIRMRVPPGFGLGAKHRIRHTTRYGQEIIYNIIDTAEIRLAREKIECLCKSGQNEG